MALSIARIRALEPRAKKFRVADGDGLSLLIRPSGKMAWICRYSARGRAGEVHLGRFPHLGPTEARKRHSELVAGIAAGQSPAEQRRAEKLAEERGETVRMFAEQYLAKIVSRKRKDVAPMRRYFEREIYPAIGSKLIAKIGVDDVRPVILRKLDEGHEQSALALRNLLKRMFDYALVRGVLDRNPMAAIPAKFVADSSSRSRALTPPEITEFLRALKIAKIKPAHKAALRLILLTLVRKSELRCAQWEHINLNTGEWEIPAENSKGREAQIVYLSSQAAALFAQLKKGFERSGCVFPARSSDSRTPMAAGTLNWALAQVPAKLNHFTVHDLRRTAATNLSEQGYQADVIEKALSHKIKGVRGIYNRAQYAEPRREMAQAWADWLDGLAGIGADYGAKGKVEM